MGKAKVYLKGDNSSSTTGVLNIDDSNIQKIRTGANLIPEYGFWCAISKKETQEGGIQGLAGLKQFAESYTPEGLTPEQNKFRSSLLVVADSINNQNIKQTGFGLSYALNYILLYVPQNEYEAKVRDSLIERISITTDNTEPINDDGLDQKAPNTAVSGKVLVYKQRAANSLCGNRFFITNIE